MRRAHTVATAILIAVLGLMSAAGTASAGAATRSITYTTQQLGAAGADYGEFRRIVGATLADPRGWSLGGRIEFRAVRDGGRLTVAFASPTVIEGVGACSAYYSCRAGDLVLINAERWRQATPSYHGRALLHSYRQMVINHEVGHALGFGHAYCTRPGAAAAVMQQQSKGLGGCERNPWPLAGERAAHAARSGTRAPAPPRPFALGSRSSHVELGERRSSVRASLGRPRRRLGGDRSAEIYARPRVTVDYARGRVAAITTRSREDVGAGGLAVGRSVPSGVRRRCAGSDPSRCEVASRGPDGGRTTLTLRAGRIVAMRVEASSDSPGVPGPREPRSAPGSVPSPLLGMAATGAATGPCAWWWAVAGRCRPASR